MGPTDAPKIMSFLRPVQLQPKSLEVAASQSWTQFMLKVLRKHRHSFADHVCLRTIRTKLGQYLDGKVPASVEDDLFHHGPFEFDSRKVSESNL